MLDFKPPKDTPVLIWLAKLLLPAVMKYGLKDTHLEIVGDGIKHFQTLAGRHTIICPNHPCPDDPQVMFAFSKKVGEDFNFLAAREVFDWDNGWRGWWFQRLGCYSVVRGAPDRESFKTTRRLIVEGKKKLVIFPEGEISHQNDTLMTLESGVAQMGFWALDEMQKSGCNQPVVLLPLAIKYTYRVDVRCELGKSLSKLQDKLALSGDSHDSFYKQLRAVSEEILEALEHEYSYKAPLGLTFNDRIVGLRTFILKNIAHFLQIDLPEDLSQLDWIRILRNALDDFIYSDERDLSKYERRIHDEKAATIRGFYRDLDRVVNFISIYDGYLRDHMTEERFADVLNRLEVEVFGHSAVKGPRLALIDVGQPLNLLTLYGEYKKNKRATLSYVNEQLASEISTMLVHLDQDRKAIFVE